ncbi:hypothetical protein [Rhodoplanes roseus]|uniref:hypothetical protein n=1 Tax=Rhodoplanes roseus TaxID=29409 RepID=UPI0011B8454B|nr:hypothetical protein [Rhodoplanes roseus]
MMCDYRCDGIWDHEGLSRSVDELPISGTLKDRLLAWQAWFDVLDDQAAEEQTAVPLATWQAFVAAGLAVARDLKRELPDWTVLYFDEIERRTKGPIESA